MPANSRFRSRPSTASPISSSVAKRGSLSQVRGVRDILVKGSVEHSARQGRAHKGFANRKNRVPDELGKGSCAPSPGEGNFVQSENYSNATYSTFWPVKI